MNYNQLLHDIRSDLNSLGQGFDLLSLKNVSDPLTLALLKGMKEKYDSLVTSIKSMDFQTACDRQSSKEK